MKKTRELSPRQKRIANLVLEGNDTATIASILRISTHTVYAHLKDIYLLLGISSRAELVQVLMERREKAAYERGVADGYFAKSVDATYRKDEAAVHEWIKLTREETEK